jgi:cellulose synthase/poly-beta-1,6-N-acetylglucosamine synthase-like glycosyltransferase
MVEPFVSIIVPTYNDENHIENCINSLKQQDYPKDRYEIIVVDNNSTDNTAEVIRRHQIIYVLEDEIQTSYAARNRGLLKSKGDIIAFTDSDCIADAQWLANGVKAFKNCKIGGIGGQVQAYKPVNFIEVYQAQKDVLGQEKFLGEENKLKRNGRILTCNAFYKKEIFEKIGLFEPSLVSGGDYDFSLRVQKNTEYLLQYEPNAIIYHKHRTTLKNFWKQYYKYGLGRIYLAKTYKNDLFSKRLEYGYLRQIYWYSRVIWKDIWDAVGLIVSSSNNCEKNRKNRLQEKFLEITSKVAFLFGQVVSSLKNRTPYFDTIF